MKLKSKCHVVVLRDLWNLFQNDMTMLVKETNLFKYANDHQLYVTGSDYNIASSRLQYRGNLAMSWYRDNFLLANTEKFQCLTVNPRNIDSDKQTGALQIEDQIITNSSQIKLLEVERDDKLNFTSHISNIYIKASQKVGVCETARHIAIWYGINVDLLRIEK